MVLVEEKKKKKKGEFKIQDLIKEVSHSNPFTGAVKNDTRVYWLSTGSCDFRHSNEIIETANENKRGLYVNVGSHCDTRGNIVATHLETYDEKTIEEKQWTPLIKQDLLDI